MTSNRHPSGEDVVRGLGIGIINEGCNLYFGMILGFDLVCQRKGMQMGYPLFLQGDVHH